MASWRNLLGGALLLVSLAAACGDDAQRRVSRDDDAGAGGEAGAGGAGAMPVAGGAGGEAGANALSSIDLATYCETVAQGYSTFLVTCYGSALYSAEQASALAASNLARCLMAEPSVEAERLAFDGAVASECVESLDPTNCDGFAFLEDNAVCRRVFTSLVEVGGECFPDAVRHFSLAGVTECADGYCDVGGEACPGQCAPLKQDDDTCQTSQECLPESYCADGVCVPRPQAGEACRGEACGPDLSCLTESAEVDGVCGPRSNPGQACSDTDYCSFGFSCLEGACRSKVDSGATCEHAGNCPDPELCLDRDADGPDAATCGGPGGLGVTCSNPYDCDVDHYCAVRAGAVCAARIALEEPCTTMQVCVLGGWCNAETGACQAVGGIGASCLENALLAGNRACEPELRCMSNGLCLPVGAEGDLCNSNDATTCQTGLFCTREDFTCQPPAAEGELCNPYSPVTCEGELGCLCDDPACQTYGGSPQLSDTLHTCLPRRAVGDPCLSSNECAVGDSCIGDFEQHCSHFGDCLPT